VRAHNFCAGPAALPLPVLERAQRELTDWQGLGASVMEVSHRSAAFNAVIESAEAALRRLLAIGDDYAVLFLQGGASQQFSAVPLNLATHDMSADYIVTGQWSKKAATEAQRLMTVNVAASSADTRFTTIPAQATWQIDSTAAFVHYCPNETIGGLEFGWVPSVVAPLVADMSSTLLSRPLDVSQFGVIYAGAQKNIGPAGLTLVIARRDLLRGARAGCPSTLDWTVQAENESMYNTPPTFAIYLAGLVFEWLEQLGGLAAMEAINRRKATLLYDLIDSNDFYASPVEPSSRSLMNVPFTLADPAVEGLFLSEAGQHRLINLQGHRSVGGMRASIYNAIEESSVQSLCDFMADFAQRRG